MEDEKSVEDEKSMEDENRPSLTQEGLIVKTPAGDRLAAITLPIDLRLRARLARHFLAAVTGTA